MKRWFELIHRFMDIFWNTAFSLACFRVVFKVHSTCRLNTLTLVTQIHSNAIYHMLSIRITNRDILTLLQVYFEVIIVF